MMGGPLNECLRIWEEVNQNIKLRLHEADYEIIVF